MMYSTMAMTHNKTNKLGVCAALPSTKQRILREEPDVVIVVGDREFLHYSQVLCLSSEYFDVALNSGMRESESLKISFPDEDPSEWELFASFMEPFSSANITKSNVEVLIPWFHRFGIKRMLHVCDRIYVDSVSPPLQRKYWKLDGHSSLPDIGNLRNRLRELLHAYAFSALYDLGITKERATRALLRQIACAPDLFDLEAVAALVAILKHEENRKDLWSSVKEYVPEDLKIEDPDCLVTNKLFPYVLHAEMQSHETSQNGMHYA